MGLSFRVRCDKSGAMYFARALLTILPLTALYACSGGGSSTPSSPVAPWEKFRHDLNNSGQATGSVGANSGTVKSVQVDLDSSKISASPAIGLDGRVYVATEGGTLAAFDPTTLAQKWSVTRGCEDGKRSGNCPPGVRPLGKIISSPAVYTVSSQTSVFVASTNGTFFTFVVGSNDVATCTMCFDPTKPSGPLMTPPDPSVTSAAFVSSPAFTTDAVSLNVNGLFIGAQVEITNSTGTHTGGKLYALNSDGMVRWQFPRPGAALIGPVTSSPAFGLSSTIHFTADENLYALANDGSFNWKFPIGTAQDPTADFASSPLTASSIFAATGAGQIVAVNPDGRSALWRASAPDGSAFVASLAIGVQASTPTPSATAPPTPTPEPGKTSTATATPTPLRGSSTLFGITKAGSVVVLDIINGQSLPLSGPVQHVGAPVESSPALSGDLFLVVGGGDGNLYAVNTATGRPPSTGTWPAMLSRLPIRSSPAIALDGTVYVGADDGKLYSVGKP